MRREIVIGLSLLSAVAVGVDASAVSAQRKAKPKAAAPAPASVSAPSEPATGEAATAVPAGGSETGADAGPATAGTGMGKGMGTSGTGSSGTETAGVTVTPLADEPAAPAASSTTGSEPAAAAGPAPEAALQRELSEVMDTLVQARARAAVLGKALWKTKVTIEVENEAEPDQVAVRVALWLDGAPVWSGDGSGLRDPERTLFSGFIAPGQHVLTYEVEQRARADEKYRYTQRASHRFTALKERRTDLKLVLDDDSDIADEFADDQEGEYDVRARLQVRAIAPEDE